MQQEQKQEDVDSQHQHNHQNKPTFNDEPQNAQQPSDIQIVNSSAKDGNQSPSINIQIMEQSLNESGGVVTNQNTQSEASKTTTYDINQQHNMTSQLDYSPNKSVILFDQSTVLPQSLNTSQQVTFAKYAVDSESSSPSRSVRSSKSNRSSILTIKPQTSNSIRSSLEQDLKTANTLYEKKRSRYRFVKSWEDKRIQITSIFNNIFCNISENLVKIGSQSNEFIDNFLCFLKDQQIQLAQFGKTNLTQVGEAYMYSPQINNVSYPSINRILKQMQTLDTSAETNYQQLSLFIDQNIIRPYLLTDKKNFNLKFDAFTTSIKERKSKIAKLAKIAVTSYDEYTNLFKEMVQLQLKGKDIKKDFYYQEVIFMHHAYEHFENLREFGLQIVRFVEELEQLQMNRTKSIHQALSLYVKKREDLIESLESTDHIKIMLQELSTDTQKKSILDIEALLQPEQANYIKKCYSKEGKNNEKAENSMKEQDSNKEISVEVLKQFAADFTLKGTSEKNLVVKEFTAQQIVRENNPNKEWKDCSIILTVDNYLIVSPGMLDSFSKPSSIIFLPYSKATFQKDLMVVTIIETQKKLFWKSKKSYRYKLQHEFDANEITSFLQNNTHVFSQKNQMSSILN